MSNIPGIGRGFGNRAVGRQALAGQMTVSAQVISLREIEQNVLAEAERQMAARAHANPNGSADVQRKADHITRNIGRTIRR